MRITLDIERDVLDLARSLADAQKISVGKALSRLARRGSAVHVPLTLRNGFSVFPSEGQGSFGPDEIRAAPDEDGLVARDILGSHPAV